MRVIRIPCYASFCISQTVEVEVVVVVRHPWMNMDSIISVPKIGICPFSFEIEIKLSN
jgi:hypothetical protein